MVALPPGPFTSMGLCVDRAESFRTLGLKRSTYSVLGWQPGVRFQRAMQERRKGQRGEGGKEARGGCNRTSKPSCTHRALDQINAHEKY